MDRDRTSSTPGRALIVEDEPNIRELVALHLSLEGLTCTQTGDGNEALRLAKDGPFDLIVLDLMLPGLDGVTVCRAIRRDSPNAGTPILMLTARSEESDKVLGLESGADDYLTKPFSLGELQARIRALLRRAGPRRLGDELRAGNLTLNLVSRRAFLDGRELVLSPKEFSLLAELLRHQGAVLSRDLLLTRIWGYDFYGDSRTVDVHVRWLREKIEEDPSHPVRIVTVRGIGYRFEG